MSRNSLPLETLPAEHLRLLPKKFHPHHELCFHLHDSMLRVFQELAAQRYPTLKLEFEDQETADLFVASEDPIGLLMELEEWDLVRRLTVGQSMMAVLGDFFNFVYEALNALQKRKFVVFYALLRKPLKENLLYLTMMLVDDQKFFENLKELPGEKFNHPGLTEQERRDYFERAVAEMDFADFIDPKRLHDVIFDMKLEDGLAPLFDKATHLSTSRSQIRTEDLNLNFIFKNPMSNDVFENVYPKLAYVLLYAFLLELRLFQKAGFDTDRVAKWYTLTGLGAYNGLFGKGRCGIKDSLFSAFGDLATCPHCESKISVQKYQAARFFTSHKVRCEACDHDHDFPLLWLLSKMDWNIFEESED